LVGHDGLVFGFTTYVVFLPNEKLGFVILTNSYITPLYPPWLKIPELMLETKEGIKPIEIELPNPVSVDENILEQYTGKYSISIVLDVSLKNNALQMKFQTGPTVNLIPISETKFIFPPLVEMFLGSGTIEFFVGDESEEDILVWKHFDSDWYDVCPKIPIVEEIPPLWHKLTGKYSVGTSSDDDILGEVELVIEDNVLVGSMITFESSLVPPFVFNPISETEILIVGGLFEGETLTLDSHNGFLEWGGYLMKPIEQEMNTVQIKQMQLHDI
jgi:hypothetical protein